MNEESIERRVAKNSVILGLVTLASKGCYYGLLVLVGRLMGPSSLGQLTTATLMAVFFGRLSSVGIEAELNRRIAMEKANAREHLEAAWGARLAASASATVIAGITWLLAGGPLAIPASIMIIVYLRQILESFRELYVAAIQGFQRMLLQAAVVVPSEIGCLGASYLYMKSDGASVFGLVLILLAVSLVRNLGFVFLIRRRLTKFSFRFSPRGVVGFVTKSWPLGLGVLFAFLMGRVDIFVLCSLEGERSVGHYQAAYSVMDGVIIVLGTVRAALFPNLAELYSHDPGRALKLEKRMFSIMLCVLCFVGLCFYFGAPIIIGRLYGAEYYASVGVLRIFGFGVLAGGMAAFASNVCVAMGKHFAVMVCSGVGCVVSAALNIVLVPYLGIKGSAYANCVTYSAMFFIMIWIGMLRDRWQCGALRWPPSTGQGEQFSKWSLLQ